jgi:chemotaxis protein histidine kinase CheA
MAMAVVESLRGQFIEQVNDLGLALARAIEAMEFATASASAQIHRIAHTLAGTAATFGYPVMGKAAFVLSEATRLCECDEPRDMQDEIRPLATTLLSMMQAVSADCA